MILSKTLRVLLAACLCAVAFPAIATPSPAETPRWVQATPFGGPIVDLEQAPSAPRILYAVAGNGRVFRSLDGGATWHRRKGSLEDDYIVDIVVAPSDAGTLYARSGGFSHLFRTRDGGLTWSRIAPELGIHAIAMDKNHPGVLFAAALDGLYRSDDGGDSWVRVAFAGEAVNGVAIDPRATDTIFAVTAGDSFDQTPALTWKSTDRGATWTSTVLPLATNISGLARFVFDPVRPEILYLAFIGFYPSWGLVLRSSDGGASWSELPVAYVLDLAAAPNGTLLAATDAGLERSSDGGATWEPPIEPGAIPPGGPPRDSLTRLLVSSAAPGELFAAGRVGIWKSGDNGASWATSHHGILAQGAYDVAVSPTGPPAVLAVAGSSVFRSADQGATWARLHSILEGPQPYAIQAFDPRHPRTVYGIDTDGQASFPVVSTNGGRQWSKLHIPFNCDSSGSICDVSLTMVELDLQDPASILAGGRFYFHFVGPGIFLLRSTDGGETWQELAPVADIGDLAIDPRRRSTYHAVGCTGLFLSTDAGATWKQTGNGLPERLCIDQRRPVLTIDPRDARRFYVSTLNQGIFASSDGGATFRAMNRGLETAPVVSLLIDPTDSSKLYAGVAGQGVFQWNAERRKWTPLNRGLPLGGFDGIIDLDPRQPSILYAASSREGVFRLDLEP